MNDRYLASNSDQCTSLPSLEFPSSEGKFARFTFSRGWAHLATYERDAVRREPFALRSSYFANELIDDLSIAMVKKIQNHYGVEIWPWDREGFTRARTIG